MNEAKVVEIIKSTLEEAHTKLGWGGDSLASRVIKDFISSIQVPEETISEDSKHSEVESKLEPVLRIEGRMMTRHKLNESVLIQQELKDKCINLAYDLEQEKLEKEKWRRACRILAKNMMRIEEELTMAEKKETENNISDDCGLTVSELFPDEIERSAGGI